MPNRDLNYEEKEDAKRLKGIWQDKKEKLNLSQVKAAQELGYSSQGAISQYLNGKVALNMQAVAKFAKLLKVGVGDISPRYASMVRAPTPEPLEPYNPPTTGSIGGVPTDTVLTWFAFHTSFCASLGVPPENLKLVRLNDESFKEMPIGTVLLIDDRYHEKAESGVYLLEQNGTIVARRLNVQNDEIQIVGGNKKMQLSGSAYGLLRIIARVISVFTPVVA
jgi:transcriptional regulator with XRE-family HTH domain